MTEVGIKPIDRYVLDSYAVIAHFERSEGWQKVVGLLEKSANQQADLYISLINLSEIYYIFHRELGARSAEQMLADINQLPIIKEDTDWNRIKAAAVIKSSFPISYADAFAASLANELKCPLVTGDPEFKKLNSLIDIEWL